MQLDCPHCDSPLRVSPTDRTMQEATGVDRQLLGDEYVCADCRNELDVYYF